MRCLALTRQSLPRNLAISGQQRTRRSFSSVGPANLAVYLGAALNTALAASKGYIGLAMGSTALVADAANSIGDVFCDVVVYYSLNAARKGDLSPLNFDCTTDTCSAISRCE